ncbi:hypothetical protein Tco_0612961 [Tanacetum coccineum]
MLAQVSNQGNVGNQNDNVVNENVQGNVGNCDSELETESELWKSRPCYLSFFIRRAGHVAYTDRFHELARLVPHLVTPESRMIESYVYGLPPQIRGMVAAIVLCGSCEVKEE